MNISMPTPDVLNKIFYCLKTLFSFLKSQISWFLFLLLILSFSVNTNVYRKYWTDYKTDSLVNEYINNGLAIEDFDCSNDKTIQAHKARMLLDWIQANAEYTSNPKKYEQFANLTSGTSFIHCPSDGK